MSEAPTTTAPHGSPTLTEVLAAVAVDVADLGGSYESIVIRQATPTMYVYRAFGDDGGEYEGGSVTFT
jgi:hypothetical protein